MMNVDFFCAVFAIAFAVGLVYVLYIVPWAACPSAKVITPNLHLTGTQ